MIWKELSKRPTTLNLKHYYEFTRYFVFLNIFISSFYPPKMSRNMTNVVAISICSAQIVIFKYHFLL